MLLLTYQPRPVPHRIRVVDFETTGAPDDEEGGPHAICEVGWCDVIDGGTRGLPGVRSWLVDPRRPIPPQASAVHHITDRDVEGAECISESLAALESEDGPVDVFCAHNAKFEQAFFDPGGYPWLCTYRIAVRLWPDAPGHSNSVLRYFLGLDVCAHSDYANNAHRAGPDALVTAALLAHCIRVADERGITVADMIRWSSGPPLLHRVNFGKHKGMLWEDLPTDYLRWMVDKSELDADTKANARYRLKQRGKS
jgi:exodeoxyribonuclease X